MAKTLVIDSHDSGSVPFLRGILTRSLQAAGLPFEHSYHVATEVRDELRDVEEITSSELRSRVAKHLEPFGRDIVERYQSPAPATPTIMVRYENGQRLPYSRGRHRMELECCGLSVDQSTRLAASIQDRLAERGIEQITVSDLARLTCDQLESDIGSEAVHDYLVWEEFKHSNRPLIVLVGGTSGTGKSTVSTRLAHLVDIVRIQSSDMLREVMRMMIPERLLPGLHRSSFEAWKVLPRGSQQPSNAESALLEGYLTQSELVSVAALATVQRALQESVSLIVEGVHVYPGFVDKIPRHTDAIIVPIMLAVLRPTELRRRLRGRGKRVSERRAQRYLANFDSLWRIQSFLLSEADRAGIPIVANDLIETTMQQVMAIVTAELTRNFDGKLED